MKKSLGTIVAIMVASILIGSFIMAKWATAEEIDRDGRFIAYDDGTVLDIRTNLMWAARDNGTIIDWANAKNYCENYRGGGYTDWRMPTIEELAALYDRSKSYKLNPRDPFQVHLSELIKLSAYCPWASDTRGSKAASFDFYLGERNWNHPSCGWFTGALPVRSGK